LFKASEASNHSSCIIIMMDATQLLQSTFHLYRHVSASRSFANTAGTHKTLVHGLWFALKSDDWSIQEVMLQ